MDFITIGNYQIPIRIDDTLGENEFRLQPQLTQEFVNRWIKENPAKAQRLLAEAKRDVYRAMHQLTSSSYTIKDDK